MSSSPLRKVILVNDAAYVNGGQARVAIDTALGLADAGIEVAFFAGNGPISDELTAANIATYGLTSHDIQEDPNRARAFVRGIWNRPIAAELSDLLAKQDPRDTIVHVHGWARSLSGAIASAIHKSGIPSLYSMHEYALACPNTAFLDYQTGEICERKPLSASCLSTQCDSRSYPQKLWRVSRTVGMRAGGWPKHLHHVAFLSDLQAEVMKPHLPPSTKMHYLPNPIGIERTSPVAVGSNRDFVFIGRLSPEKGPVLLAQAAKQANVTVRFVGDGPLVDAVKAANQDAIMMGWQDKQGVQNVLEGARALVLPSLCYETHGMSAYEACARGVPVITGDRCAARESIIDGETGLIFKTGDLASLTAALKQLAQSDNIAEMGARTFEHYWRAPLTRKVHIEKLNAIYQQVLQA